MKCKKCSSTKVGTTKRTTMKVINKPGKYSVKEVMLIHKCSECGHEWKTTG